jgi:hypothetical protein
MRCGPVPLFAGLVGISILGCGAGWHQPPRLTPGPWPPRQQVQVWTGRQVIRWHSVALEADSLSGVPFVQPQDCDSCRTWISMGEVDSVRVGNPEAGFLKTMGLLFGTPVLFFTILCSTSSEGGPPCSGD